MAATICAVGTPKRRSLVAFSCPDFATGLDAVRRVVQDGHRPAAIRLYDAVEARERLGLDPARGEAALLVVIVEGPAGLVAATNHDLRETAANLGLRTSVRGSPRNGWRRGSARPGWSEPSPSPQAWPMPWRSRTTGRGSPRRIAR